MPNQLKFYNFLLRLLNWHQKIIIRSNNSLWQSSR